MNRLLALWQSTIGKKIIMAVTGLLLVLFLVSHMISNTLVFVNPSHLDVYGAWLRGFGPFFWAARIGLYATFLLHVVTMVQLTRINRAARTTQYARFGRRVNYWGARTMRIGGVILLAFLIFHVLHLTNGYFHPDWHEGAAGRNLIVAMQQPGIALIYLVAMLALAMHFSHGVWSALQSLGITHPAWNRTRRGIAVATSILVAGGLATIPLAGLLGLLR